MFFFHAIMPVYLVMQITSLSNVTVRFMKKHFSIAESRSFENLYDPAENICGIHDDLGGSLRQRQSFSQQYPCRGRCSIHQRTTELTGVRGEQTLTITKARNRIKKIKKIQASFIASYVKCIIRFV